MIRTCCISLAAALFSASKILATPQLSFPVNSQVPPVAIPFIPYNFSFSPNTFRSSSDISYSVSNEPSWLKIDSTTHTFSGTPRSEDVGDVNFVLRASDSDGEIECSVTLVVRSKREIQVGELAVLPQLVVVGSVSAPATLLLHPAEEFSFTFEKNTFVGNLDRTVYYAVSYDNSPLPSWIHFDAQSLSFSGVTPPNLSQVALQEEYSLSLIASNVPGFSEAYIEFEIAVATHILSFKTPIRSISVFAGEPIILSSFLDELSRDGLSLARSDLASVSSNHPDWLELDDEDLSMQGNAPSKSQNASFHIDVVDCQGNKASQTLNLEVLDQDYMRIKSKADLGIVNVTAGTFFKHTIGSLSMFNNLINIDVDLGVASPWLSFDPTNMSIYGQVPLQPTPMTMNISFEFSRGKTLVQQAELQIEIVSDIGTMSGTSTLPSTQSATATASAISHNQSTNITHKQIVTLVLGIALPSLTVVVLIIVILGQLRKRRKKAIRGQGKRPQGHDQMMENPTGVGFSSMNYPSPAYGDSSKGQKHGTTPSVELPWAPDSIRRTKHRMSKQQRTSILNTMSSSGQPSRNVTSSLPLPVLADSDMEPSVGEGKKPKRHKNESQVCKDTMLPHSGSPPVLGRRVLGSTHNVQRLSKAQKASVRLDNLNTERAKISHQSSTSQRVASGNQQGSWQTISDSTLRVSSHSSLIALNQFPLPPQSLSDGMVAASSTKREESSASLSSMQSFEVRRQHFHTQRARDKLEGVARFSNAGTWRSGMWAFNENSLMRELSSGSEGSLVSVATGERISETFYAHSRPADHLQQQASSHRFAHTTSPESQWVGHRSGMDDLTLSIDGEGGRRRESRVGLNERTSTSARLPFHAGEKENESSAETRGDSYRRPRLSDQRKHVSVESSESMLSMGSHRGSFRFI